MGGSDGIPQARVAFENCCQIREGDALPGFVPKASGLFVAHDEAGGAGKHVDIELARDAEDIRRRANASSIYRMEGLRRQVAHDEALDGFLRFDDALEPMLAVSEIAGLVEANGGAIEHP